MIKYAPSRYVHLLHSLGCTRVGTLYDFRRTEHQRGISDPQEGKKQVHYSTQPFYARSTNDPEVQGHPDFRALEEFGAIHFDNCAHVYIGDVHLSREFDVPDCFIYCVSQNVVDDLYTEFGDADCRVAIQNSKQFFRLLTIALHSIRPVRFKGLFGVQYRLREEAWNGKDWGAHPCLIKEPQYLHQAEARAIWEPIGPGPISPVVVGHKEIPGHVGIPEPRVSTCDA